MKRLIAFIVFFGGLNFAFSQSLSGSWEEAQISKEAKFSVLYFENYPFTFKDKEGNLTGIEIDILNDFAKWLKAEKNIDLKLEFNKSGNFSKFYSNLQNSSPNTIGLGSLAISVRRKDEINFTAPYMKNQSVLVSNLEVPTTRYFNDLENNFCDLTALVISGSSHEAEMLNIKNQFYPKMRVKYMETPKDLLQLVFEDKNYFGYVDLLSYWAFLQQRCCTMKIHKDLALEPEYFALGLPLNSDWDKPFSEFFEGGFGYTATEGYRKILEKYLGYEIIQSVELY